MARDRYPRDTDAPVPDSLDDEDDKTPRAIDLPGVAWKKSVEAKKLARELEREVQHLKDRQRAVEQHLFGFEGQPASGVLARTDQAIGDVRRQTTDMVTGIEKKLGDMGKEIEHVRFLQWKIITAAALGGTFGALVIQGLLWLASRSGA